MLFEWNGFYKLENFQYLGVATAGWKSKVWVSSGLDSALILKLVYARLDLNPGRLAFVWAQILERWARGALGPNFKKHIDSELNSGLAQNRLHILKPFPYQRKSAFWDECFLGMF